MKRRQVLAGVAGVLAATASGCSEATCGDDYGHRWNVNANGPHAYLRDTGDWDDGTFDVNVEVVNETRCSIQSAHVRAAVHEPDGDEITSGQTSIADIPTDSVGFGTVEMDVGESLDEYRDGHQWHDVIDVTVNVTF